jgi:hypothetical protein
MEGIFWKYTNIYAQQEVHTTWDRGANQIEYNRTEIFFCKLHNGGSSNCEGIDCVFYEEPSYTMRNLCQTSWREQEFFLYNELNA